MPADYDYVIEKFGRPKGGHVLKETDVSRLRGALPDSYLVFLTEIGVGTWMDGFFSSSIPKNISRSSK